MDDPMAYMDGTKSFFLTLSIIASIMGGYWAFEFLMGGETPLAVRFFIAIGIPIFLVGVVVYFLRVLWRRWTLSHAASSNVIGDDIERSISGVVHKTYDHRDTDNAAANIGSAEQLAKLAAVHADGALSDGEFKALKTRIISEINRKADKKETEDTNSRKNRAGSGRGTRKAAKIAAYSVLALITGTLIVLALIANGVISPPEASLFKAITSAVSDTPRKHDIQGLELGMSRTNALEKLTSMGCSYASGEFEVNSYPFQAFRGIPRPAFIPWNASEEHFGTAHRNTKEANFFGQATCGSNKLYLSDVAISFSRILVRRFRFGATMEFGRSARSMMIRTDPLAPPGRRCCCGRPSMATMGGTHKQVPKRPPQNGKGIPVGGER